MIAHILAGTLTALGAAQSADTVVSAGAGDRVAVRNHAGSITVRTWDRDAVQVRVDGRRAGDLEIRRDGSTLRVRLPHPSHGHGSDDDADLLLRVPAAVDLELFGPDADIEVEGSRGDVRAETVEGTLRLEGGSGRVSLHTTEGDVEVRGARGSVEAHSVDGHIRMEDISGAIVVEAIDGDIRLLRIDSDDVRVSTVDGDIFFDGRIHESGRYRLTTHDGDVSVRVPEATDATVTVSTFDGDFIPDFPVEWRGTREGRRMEFTLGDGGARIELESFDGEIRLLRPSSAFPDER